MVIVRPVEIDDILVNPGMGIQTFQRVNGQPLNPPLTWSEDGAAEVVEGTLAAGVFPASSMAYYRWFWSTIEPEQGRYRWEIVDRAIAAARAHGQTLAFRIMPYDGTHPLPEWYRASGARRANQPADPDGTVWHPDLEDTLYLRRWGELVAAAAARYDGHPFVEAVDISSMGYWGEGNPAPSPSLLHRQALVDLWPDAFKTTPLLMNSDDDRTMAHGVGRGAGFRMDCLGDLRTGPDHVHGWSHMRDLYPQQIARTGIQDAWKRAPVHFETCWTPAYWKEHGWDVEAILRQALRWHVSALNVKSTPIPREQARAFDELQKKMGYRLVLKRLSYQRAVRAGQMAPVHMHWFNAGVAPPYRPWVLAIQLYARAAAAVIRLPVDVRRWLPDDAVFDGALYVPEDLAAGEYRLRVGLLDPRTDRPAVRLAIQGRDVDGWYDLGPIAVAR
jgi:hypothetical protein